MNEENTEVKPTTEQTLTAPVQQMKTLDYIGRKLFAGRFVLTIGACFAFLIIIATICKIMITKADSISNEQIFGTMATVFLVIQNVFSSYFMKNAFRDNQSN